MEGKTLSGLYPVLTKHVKFFVSFTNSSINLLIMKKFTKLETCNGSTLKGAILVALSLISNVMVAQFQPATINETVYPIGHSAISGQTGNDIQSETIEGTKYEMAVTV